MSNPVGISARGKPGPAIDSRQWTRSCPLARPCGLRFHQIPFAVSRNGSSRAIRVKGLCRLPPSRRSNGALELFAVRFYKDASPDGLRKIESVFHPASRRLQPTGIWSTTRRPVSLMPSLSLYLPPGWSGSFSATPNCSTASSRRASCLAHSTRLRAVDGRAAKDFLEFDAACKAQLVAFVDPFGQFPIRRRGLLEKFFQSALSILNLDARSLRARPSREKSNSRPCRSPNFRSVSQWPYRKGLVSPGGQIQMSGPRVSGSSLPSIGSP